MANALTLKILSNLGEKMSGTAGRCTSSASSYVNQNQYQNRNNGSRQNNQAGNRMTIDSYASSKGAVGTAAKSNDSGVQQGTSASKAVVSSYENAIKSLINKSSGVSSRKDEPCDGTRKGQVPTSGRVGLDALIETLGR